MYEQWLVQGRRYSLLVASDDTIRNQEGVDGVGESVLLVQTTIVLSDLFLPFLDI